MIDSCFGDASILTDSRTSLNLLHVPMASPILLFTYSSVPSRLPRYLLFFQRSSLFFLTRDVSLFYLCSHLNYYLPVYLVFLFRSYLHNVFHSLLSTQYHQHIVALLMDLVLLVYYMCNISDGLVVDFQQVLMAYSNCVLHLVLVLGHLLSRG